MAKSQDAGQSAEPKTHALDGVNRKLDLLNKSVDSATARIEELERDVYRQLQRANTKIEESLHAVKIEGERAIIELEVLKPHLERRKEADGHDIDIKGIKRDLEILYIRIADLEKKASSQSLDEIHNKLEDISNQIQRLKVTAPTIIE